MSTIERIKAFMQREIVPNRYVEGGETIFFGLCFAFLAVQVFRLQGIAFRSVILPVVAVGYFVCAWAIITNRDWGYLLKCMSQAFFAIASLFIGLWFLSAFIAYYAFLNWRQYSYLRALRVWQASHQP